MSLIVVIKGPEATAGSIFILCITSGINDPANVAIINVKKIEIPTRRPSNKSCCQKKIITVIKIPQIDPVINPVPASRIISFHLLSFSKSPVAIPQCSCLQVSQTSTNPPTTQCWLAQNYASRIYNRPMGVHSDKSHYQWQDQFQMLLLDKALSPQPPKHD